MASSSPSWSESSVRWLRYHHPGVTPASSIQTFDHLLSKALSKVKYTWEGVLEHAVRDWSKVDHERLMAHMTREAYKESKSVTVSKVKVAVHDSSTGKTELIGLEMDDIEAVENLASAPPSRKSQLAPAHELEEAVQSEAMKADPRFGAW